VRTDTWDEEAAKWFERRQQAKNGESEAA
jgi:hypothetical protein